VLLGGDTVAIFLAIAVGMRWHRAVIERRQPKPPKPPNLNCGCGHVLSYHDPVSGVCTYQTQNWVHEPTYTTSGKLKGSAQVTKMIPCACKQYTGELTADWYARSIMRGELPEGEQQ
jgi:hypothetical protein